jgi:hypothetical protein
VPVPASIADLSQTPASNYPLGSEPLTTADDYFRTYAAFIAELRDRGVSDEDFGAVGDGSTDDTTALTDFWNHAIANPGVPHRLRALTYKITAAMPAIEVSGVIIRGAGAEIHDVGSSVTGSVLLYAGAATPTPIVRVRPVAGGSAQRVAYCDLSGFAVHCASLAQYGAEFLSVRECVLNVPVLNATTVGTVLGVIAGSLGESKDLQKCKITIKGRQVESSGGSAYAVRLDGDSSANVSMNEIWLDVQHKDVAAADLVNADNNDWVYFRAYRVGGGTATESASIRGGATSGVACRAERFWFYNGTVGAHIYGTSTGSPTYAVGSTGHIFFCLDTENGTPVPTIETGGSASYRKSTTVSDDTPWVSYTPSVSSLTGTITSASATGMYIRRGNIVHLKGQINITTNGTGATAIDLTVPFTSAGSLGQIFSGRERSSGAGRMFVGYLDSGASAIRFVSYDGTYPGADGYVMTFSGFYQVS